MNATATVVSPVRYVQVGEGPIRDSAGLALIVGTPTYVLVERLMRKAATMARATGSVGSMHADTVHGVEIRAAWARDEASAVLVVEDDEPEPEVEFSLDDVVDALHRRGIPAYVDQTGGGCATIYAGGKHVLIDGGEEDVRFDVAAGPGTYSYGPKPSTALLAEFYVGPNDTEGDEHATLPDTITTAAQAVAWSVDAIERAVALTESRSFGEWNARPCRYCGERVHPGPNGSWQTPDLTPCKESEDAQHGSY